MKIFSFITILFLVWGSNILAQQMPVEYKVQKSIPVKGNGSWNKLTLDYSKQRIFVTHGDCVQVIDMKTGDQVGIINHTPGAGGIAVAHDFKKGFITASKIDSVIVFDLDSYQVTDRIPTGKNPDAILFDQFSARVFAFNTKGNSTTVIDPDSNKVVSTVALRGTPAYALTDVSGSIYVTLQNLGIIAKLDAVKLDIRGMFPLGPDKQPTGLALDKGNDNLFCSCIGTNELVVVDRYSGYIVATVPIGMHCEGVCFMPSINEIFTSNGEGSITVIHQDTPDKYSKEQTLITKRGARTLACDYVHKSIYLPTAEFNDEKKDFDPNSFQIIMVSK